MLPAVVGVPAALAVTWAVEMPNIGRKGALAISSGKLFHRIQKHMIQPLLAKTRVNWHLSFCEHNRAEL